MSPAIPPVQVELYTLPFAPKGQGVFEGVSQCRVGLLRLLITGQPPCLPEVRRRLTKRLRRLRRPASTAERNELRRAARRDAKAARELTRCQVLSLQIGNTIPGAMTELLVEPLPAFVFEPRAFGFNLSFGAAHGTYVRVVLLDAPAVCQVAALVVMEEPPGTAPAGVRPSEGRDAASRGQRRDVTRRQG